jgi:hypothetical protein
MATTARRKKAEAFLETVGADVSKAIRAGKSTDLPLRGGTLDAQRPSGSIFRGGGGGGAVPSSLPTRRVPQSPSQSEPAH